MNILQDMRTRAWRLAASSSLDDAAKAVAADSIALAMMLQDATREIARLREERDHYRQAVLGTPGDVAEQAMRQALGGKT